ncbi:MAG TPA: protein kinase [Verrucomicrobiae bacterium]|nr:protein kinase [Verrucomicrobiae bacterium]
MPSQESQDANDKHPMMPGDKLGAYEILSTLGSGGMGVVYKARDTKLGRLVALKFLRDADRDGEAARARLLLEAKNASALNHPHIATIYEVGESGGRAYIAMEFIEGRSLSAVIERDSLAPETAIRYGLEISAALAHAHERGIVHRDLKPANVMITTAGNVKVLDFGLAIRTLDSDLSAVTRSREPITKEGGAVGTLLYMAPETLRGEEADARTDLWALGAVLYEMLIGHAPFAGRTPYEISWAILREPPKSFPAHVPLRLQAVIQRCLAKEREHRYQRASEVHAALETAGIDVLASSAHSVASGTAASLPAARPGRLKWLALGGSAAALVLLGWGGYEIFGSKPAPRPPASSDQWTQITDFADFATSPELSPDGKILTFIHGPSPFFGPGQIDAKVMPNGDPVELTHDGTLKMSPDFSPDGSSIDYSVYDEGKWDIWTVPLLGGEARKTITNAEGLTWIDPSHLLFSEIKTGSHMAVVTGGAGGESRRDVYVPPRERGMAHRSAVSPDHKWVLLAEMDNGGWLPCKLVLYEGSSAPKPVGPPDAACTDAAWSPDGKWMYLNSESGGRFHVWRQRFPEGQPEQLTSGATEEQGIALAPDGNSFITSVGLRESTIWVHDAKGDRRISSQGFAIGPTFSRDGKKLYYLVRRHGFSGQFVAGELWVADLATNHSERALPGFEISGYTISPDGRNVVFAATDKNNVPSLWIASLDLQFPPRQLPSSENEDQPHFDAAGDLYCRSTDGKRNFIYRTKLDGSAPERAYPDPILELNSVSPDGKWAVVWAPTEGTNAVIAAYPLPSGKPVPICNGDCGGGWSADGRTFAMSFVGMDGGFTAIVPVPHGGLPALPPGGIVGRADAESLKGAKVFDATIYPGPLPGQFASQRQEAHSNLYRIPLP